MGTEEHFVMQADGKVVRARAVREMETKLALSDFDVLVSTPHDPTGTIRAAVRDAGRGGHLAMRMITETQNTKETGRPRRESKSQRRW